MSSPSQRRGGCGHMMAGFDPHAVCARCHDKKKGTDPCVEKEGANCRHCNAPSPEQLAQLSTPSYKLKKEKRDMKSSTPSKNPVTDDTLSPTLVDPSLVMVMGVVDGQSPAGPSDLSDKPVEKRKKEEQKKEKKATTSKKPDKSVKSSHRPSTESTDQKLELMEQKWSDRFNRLEALLLAKTLDISTVKVTPTHAPPANAISSQPFLKPSSSSQPSDRPATSVPPATDHVDVTTASKAGSDSSQPSHRPETSGMSGQPAKRSFSTAFDLSRRESSSSDSDSESVTSDRPPVDLYPEEGELSDDHEVSLTDPDQSLSEEQSYRETMRGIRSYMGWTHVPDLDSGTKTSDDNPFAGPKLEHPGKVSVNLPTDEWLCNKLSKLNITLVQGYPSPTTEAGTLQRDQFVRPAKSQSKWYGVHSETKDSGSTPKSWNTSKHLS